MSGTPMTVSYHTVGSWFPTGYYGHYRSRARADFINEYRQLAKPQPPQKFVKRAIQPATFHQFSLHDNRNSFQSDASYFEQGLGRKSHPARSGVCDPSFLSWPAYRSNPNKGRPLTSTYRKDFQIGNPNTQMLVKRPLTSFDGVPSTTYRTIHGNDSPNHNLINALNNEALMISARGRQYQVNKKKMDYRETVASCLSWYRPCVPQATCHTNYEPGTEATRLSAVNNGIMTPVTSAAHTNQNATPMTESYLPVQAVSE